MRIVAPLAALVLFAATLTAAPPGAAPPIFDGLRLGSHHVGYDETATRRLPVGYWYPTAASTGKVRAFSDYLGEDGPSLQSILEHTHVPAADATRYISSRMTALTGAKPEAGPFPLVLVAQGNGQSVADQAVLCEFLASHGFVVATTESPTREEPMESEEDIPKVADRQARDLTAMILRMKTLPFVDARHPAVAGHSFGARAALLLAMRDPTVQKIVSLDGGIGAANGVDEFRKAPGWNPRVRTSILHFFERRDPAMKPDFQMLRSLPGVRLQTLEAPGLSHVHFSMFGFAAAAFPSVAQATNAGPSLAADLRMVAARTLTFLSSRQ